MLFNQACDVAAIVRVLIGGIAPHWPQPRQVRVKTTGVVHDKIQRIASGFGLRACRLPPLAPDAVGRFRADPQGFLDDVRLPAILDEIQNVPEILACIRARIDRTPNAKGRWLLTGSQEAPLMKGVTESMAGRAAVLELLPFSSVEHAAVSSLRGGFPEVLARPATSAIWFRSYLQTYLERDVRAITAVRDLATFRRFLSLVASRVGQVLNKTELAASANTSTFLNLPLSSDLSTTTRDAITRTRASSILGNVVRWGATAARCLPRNLSASRRASPGAPRRATFSRRGRRAGPGVRPPR